MVASTLSFKKQMKTPTERYRFDGFILVIVLLFLMQLKYALDLNKVFGNVLCSFYNCLCHVFSSHS